jgi:hypothetical protein
MSGILDSMIEFQRAHDYPFSFSTQASVNLGSPELAPLLTKMKHAGFGSVFLGIENPNPAALRAMNKKQNMKVDIPTVVRRIQAQGVEVLAGFILGGDEDTPATAGEIVEFVKRNRIFTAMAGILTPVPHTPLHERLRSEGRLLPAEYTGNNTDDEIQFTPRHFTPVQLQAGIHEVLVRLFAPAAAYHRGLDMVASLRIHIFNRSPVQPRYLKAAAISFWRQGIRRRDPAYFDLLVRAMRLDRRLARRWRARARRVRRALRDLQRGGPLPGHDVSALEMMFRFAYEYALRFDQRRSLSSLAEWLADARSRLHAGTLTIEATNEASDAALRFMRLCGRRHRFPGLALARAIEAGIKVHHYESVMLAIVGRGDASEARLVGQRNGRAAMPALTPLLSPDSAIEAIHSRDRVLRHKRGRAHVRD